MKIEARRVLAVEYRCPQCGRSSASLAMTPTKRHRERRPICTWCEVTQEIVRRRYYTQFAADLCSVAGTCEKIGQFRVCNYVYPNIRAFKRVVQRRAEEARAYYEQERQRQALLPPAPPVDDDYLF